MTYSGTGRAPVLASSFLLLLSGLPGWVPRQQPVGAGTQPKSAPATVTAQAPAPKPTLADFAWLEGRWQGSWGPRVAEQVWLAPKAGMMIGVFRLIEDDKTLVTELFALLEKPDGIDFRFRHFTPDLVVWEKSDATLLKLASLDAKKVDFENPVNGEPKRAILTRLDADTYVSRSEIVPEKGDMQVIEITYHRQKPAADHSSGGNGEHR